MSPPPRAGPLWKKTHTVTVDVEEIAIVAGKAVRRRVQKTVEQPLYDAYPVVDEQGEPVLDEAGQPLIHRVVQTEEIDVPDTAAVSQTFQRRHFGVVAQQVEEVLSALDINLVDFAPLTKDEESGVYGVRYTELVPLLGRTIQDLLERVEALEAARES